MLISILSSAEWFTLTHSKRHSSQQSVSVNPKAESQHEEAKDFLFFLSGSNLERVAFESQLAMADSKQTLTGSRKQHIHA